MDSRPTSARNASTVEVTPMSRSDVVQTAALHEAHLPNGLFPALGQRFVRHWHRTFITSPHACALVARDANGRCCGFLIGTVDQGPYTAEVLHRDGWRLAVAGTIALVLRPRLAIHFVRTRMGRYLRRIAGVFRRTGPITPEHTGTAGSVAVLHAIVTIPEARGQGIAAALLDDFEATLRARKVPQLQLITLADGGAADFYRRRGYVETAHRNNRDGEPIVQFDHHPGGPR